MTTTKLYACPDCGDPDDLEIAVRTWARLDQSDPDNLQTYEGKDASHDWDNDANIVCLNCRWSGQVRNARNLLCSEYDAETDERVRAYLNESGYSSVEDWALDSDYRQDDNSPTGWTSIGMSTGFDGEPPADIYECIVDAIDAQEAAWLADLDTPPTCILTGEPGENDDDCTTHNHEEPA